ncbi:MAG: ABC transporter permease [Planctomycetota bacterium]|nr:ABC transporter permease [Planctomycetota bacterium]
MRTPASRLALAWIVLITLVAAFAPLLASSRPLSLAIDAAGPRHSPLLESLDPLDWTLALAAPLLIGWCLLGGPRRVAGRAALASLLLALGVGAASIVQGLTPRPPEVFGDETRAAHLDLAPRWTLVPFSPAERSTDAPDSFLPPGTRTVTATLSAILPAAPELSDSASLSPERLAQLTQSLRSLPLTPSERDALERDLAARITPGAALTHSDLRAIVEHHTAALGRVHILGTDARGHDVASHLIHGCRVAVSVGIIAAAISTIIGVSVGAAAGFMGGAADALLSRVIDAFASIPVLFVLVIAAGVLPRQPHVIMAVIGCLTWTGCARLTRAAVIAVRSSEYVLAARAAGAGPFARVTRHVLPNALAPVIIDVSFSLAAAIVIESGLSFLGLTDPGSPSWGSLLASAVKDTGSPVWWLAFAPGLVLFLTCLSYNTLGEALRDTLDPRSRRHA